LSWARIWAIFKARNMEFVRDRSAMGWNFAFPALIVAGFAFAFSGKPLDMYKVGVLQTTGAKPDLVFFKTDYIKFIPQRDREEAIIAVERHQLDMLIDTDNRRFWINQSSPKGYILERVLYGTLAQLETYTRATVTGREVRYVDWVVPGVLAMNMMFSALFGIGFVIVRYRKNGVLKRLKATPLTAFEFLTAQVMSRLWLIMLVAVLVFIGTDYFIDFTMHGAYLDLFIIFTLGSLCMISLSLLVAARVRNEELAGGLLNLISWPMMFLSGVWFSNEGIHPLLQKVAQALPLTHLLDASRAIMIDGSNLAGVSSQLFILLIMTAVFMLMGAMSFKWE